MLQNQSTVACSKSTMETLEQYVNTDFTHCSGVSIVDFETVMTDWNGR